MAWLGDSKKMMADEDVSRSRSRKKAVRLIKLCDCKGMTDEDDAVGWVGR